jgi:curved DNA-binding protein CbpA
MALKDNRHFRRYQQNSDIIVESRKNSYKGRLINYSLEGMATAVSGGLVLEKGDVIGITSSEPDIRTVGEVRWSAERDRALLIGIRNIGQLKGCVRDFRICDTLIGLQRSQTTGILTFENGPTAKKVYIRNGDMIFSASNQLEDRLGDILLREGKITQAQYDRSVEEMKRTGQRQGAVLVRLGAITAQGLIEAVKHHVEEIIESLFLMENGWFSFEKSPLPIDEVITLKLSAANLIYYGIQKAFNSGQNPAEALCMDSVPHFASDPLDLFQDIRLDESGKRVLSFIDGKTPVKDIIAATRLEAFEVLKTIFALSSVRIIETNYNAGVSEAQQSFIKEALSEQPGRMDPLVKEEIEEMHRKYEDIGYYGVLGIKDTASLAEIRQAYYRAAKRFHPDAHFCQADDSLIVKLSDIFSHVYEAYTTLSNPQRRKEYDKLITIKPAKTGVNQSRARAKFEAGKEQFRLNLFQEAALLFGQAAYFDSTVSEYHYYYGLSLAMQSRLTEAEKALKKAIELDLYNATYLAELGFIYIGLGFSARARGMFEKARKVSPENRRTWEGLAQLRTTR